MSLIVDHITKRFGNVVALDDASFTLEPGRIFGLLGANGAGKTTSMRIVLFLALALLAVTVVAAIWLASRIYSAAVLLYGQRIGIRSVLRATRVAR